MDNISIISIPDSETSACGGVGALLNETYSPPKNQLPPVTPKREAVDTTLNATFTPEDNKTPKVQDETFSPVKEVVEKEEVKPVVNKRTPKKKLPEVTLSFDSPAPNPPNVPDILVVPPTAERRPLRRSVRTPAKNVEPVATRASTRISTRQQQTPLKTVPEKKKGRKAKKEEEEEVEEVEKKALETEVVETKAQQAKKDEEEDSKIKVSEDVKLPLIENDPVEEAKPAPPPVVVDDEEVPEKRQRMTLDEVVEPQPEAVKEEEENQESVSKVAETSTTEKQTPPPLIETSRSLLFETEQPTLLESSQVQPMDDTHEDNDDDDEEEVEGDDQPLEKTEEFRVPMFATDVLPKSIRKRSLSVADMNPPVAKRNFRVQFHSPGNMEKTITEIDESLYMNFTKSFASSFSIPATTTAAAACPPTTESAAKVKPLRRKRRSLSNAETPVDKLATLQFLSDRHQPKKVATTGSATKKIPTPSPRKKMPNFAAIHQSIFQQMESLVDFKERKKERAQFLLTSATTPTSEARANIVKPVSRGAIGKASKGVVKQQHQASNLMKPKHRTIGKRPVVPAGSKLTEKKLAAILQSTDFPAIMGDTPIEEGPVVGSVEGQGEEGLMVAQPEETKENVTASKTSKIKVPRVYNKEASIKPRPLNVPTSMTGLRIRSAPPAKTKEAAATKTETAETKPTAVNAYKIVKGVRMNRRFELMMKHRNNQTTNEKN